MHATRGIWLLVEFPGRTPSPTYADVVAASCVLNLILFPGIKQAPTPHQCKPKSRWPCHFILFIPDDYSVVYMMTKTNGKKKFEIQRSYKLHKILFLDQLHKIFIEPCLRQWSMESACESEWWSIREFPKFIHHIKLLPVCMYSSIRKNHSIMKN